jgi:hypothetical protein
MVCRWWHQLDSRIIHFHNLNNCFGLRRNQLYQSRNRCSSVGPLSTRNLSAPMREQQANLPWHHPFDSLSQSICRVDTKYKLVGLRLVHKIQNHMERTLSVPQHLYMYLWFHCMGVGERAGADDEGRCVQLPIRHGKQAMPSSNVPGRHWVNDT